MQPFLRLHILRMHAAVANKTVGIDGLNYMWYLQIIKVGRSTDTRRFYRYSKHYEEETMAYLDKINLKLKRAFGGKVTAREENSCLILSGELSCWHDIVSAGRMAVNKKLYAGLVNDIICTGASPAPPRMPALTDSALEGASPDVLVIGGGVTGCAIARELSRYKLDVLLVEKEHDLALQTSGRNDGMVHSGIDLKKNSLKYHYNRLGNRMYDEICAQLDVEFDRCGQYICFEKIWWKPILYFTLIYWKWLGLDGVRVLNKKELLNTEPSVSPKSIAALFFPASGVVCPYNLTIAYAENAAQNGARVFLDTAVLDMDSNEGVIKSVSTNRGTIYPKIVVNAAGVFCEEIAKMANDRFFSIHPRKGTNAILDKKYNDAIVRTAISSIETVSAKSHTKGGGIIHTVDGNTLIGPDAVETIEKEDFATSRDSIRGTFGRQEQACPALSESQIITYFSGVRAPTYEEDFVVCKGRTVKNMVHAAGIQSPGLTAAPAIGLDVTKMVVDILEEESEVKQNDDFDPVRRIAPRAAKLDDKTRAKLIEENPDYGVIVCRCEEISKGEILDALRRTVPCDTIDGVKRRVRPGMGRCQGGFCGPIVLDIIAKEKNIPPESVKKSGANSELLLGSTKEVSADD